MIENLFIGLVHYPVYNKNKKIVISTWAKERIGSTNYSEARKIIGNPELKTILFGTGFGLSENIIKESDSHLKQIMGMEDYIIIIYQ